MKLTLPGCTLFWSLTDLTPIWATEPETVVMHHGIGANQHIFDGWLAALAGRHRIPRFDMRGHGGSERPDPDGSPFIPVPVMTAFSDLVPDARLHVIGHAKHGLPFSHATVCFGLLANFIEEQTLYGVDPPSRGH
jgi:pimeloyl-ACP methyl ester carboxylesterase